MVTHHLHSMHKLSCLQWQYVIPRVVTAKRCGSPVNQLIIQQFCLTGFNLLSAITFTVLGQHHVNCSEVSLQSTILHPVES